MPADLDRATWLAELLAVLRASGRTPSRATEPARLVAQVDVEELRRRLREPQPPLFAVPGQEPVAPPPAAATGPVVPAPAPAREPHRQGGAGLPGRYPHSRTISPHAFEPWCSERASVVQIETLLELREEGARMCNCVASYRPWVERGDLVVFSAKVDGKPITIAIRPCMSGWRLREWKGFANRRLTAAEVDALRPWMQASGVADAWRGG